MIAKKALDKLASKNPIKALVMLAFFGDSKAIKRLMKNKNKEANMVKLVTRLQALTKDELLDLSEKSGLRKRDEKVFLASTLYGLTHDEISYKYSISLSSVARSNNPPKPRKSLAFARYFYN